MQPAKVVDGIDIYIEGEGPETIVMIHGWPDTYRLWDAQVAELKQRYRCVRFTLPGFDIDKPRRSYTLNAMIRILLHIVNSVSQKQKVILMLHDWGCVFGYEFYMRNKTLVSTIIGVDIGDAQSKATGRSRSRDHSARVFSSRSSWHTMNALPPMRARAAFASLSASRRALFSRARCRLMAAMRRFCSAGPGSGSDDRGEAARADPQVSRWDQDRPRRAGART